MASLPRKATPFRNLEGVLFVELRASTFGELGLFWGDQLMLPFLPHTCEFWGLLYPRVLEMKRSSATLFSKGVLEVCYGGSEYQEN